MKRNDMSDSYVFGCSSGSLRRGEPPKRAIMPLYAGKHSAQPSQVNPVRCTERLCRHANYWKCPVVMVSIPLARRHGKRVVWRRRGAAQALKHRNQVLRACALVVIEDDVAPRLREWRAAKGT